MQIILNNIMDYIKNMMIQYEFKLNAGMYPQDFSRDRSLGFLDIFIMIFKNAKHGIQAGWCRLRELCGNYDHPCSSEVFLCLLPGLYGIAPLPFGYNKTAEDFSPVVLYSVLLIIIIS